MTEATVYRTRMATVYGEDGEVVFTEESTGLIWVTLDIPTTETQDIDVFPVWWRPYAKLLRQRLRALADEPARDSSSAPVLRVVLPIPSALLTDTGFHVYEEAEPQVREAVLMTLIRDRDRLLRERAGAA